MTTATAKNTRRARHRIRRAFRGDGDREDSVANWLPGHGGIAERPEPHHAGRHQVCSVIGRQGSHPGRSLRFTASGATTKPRPAARRLSGGSTGTTSRPRRCRYAHWVDLRTAAPTSRGACGPRPPFLRPAVAERTRSAPTSGSTRHTRDMERSPAASGWPLPAATRVAHRTHPLAKRHPRGARAVVASGRGGSRCCRVRVPPDPRCLVEGKARFDRVPGSATPASGSARLRVWPEPDKPAGVTLPQAT